MFINARTSIVFLYARTSIVVLNARTSIVMHACLRPLHAAEFYRISLHACMQAPTSCVPDVASMITYRYTILFVADIQSCTHALSLKQYFMCNKRAYMAVIYLHITTKQIINKFNTFERLPVSTSKLFKLFKLLDHCLSTIASISSSCSFSSAFCSS